MKNQWDWIIAVVSLLLAGIIAFVWMQTRRQVTKPAPPAPPVLTPVSYPAVSVQYATALPGAGAGGGGGSGAGGGGGGGFKKFKGGGGPARSMGGM